MTFIKHGQHKTRLYRIWQGIKQRCLNPNHPSFHNYGGRGIAVSCNWTEFAGFYKWARSSGYRDDLTIERKNNDGDYNEWNCTWATRLQQANNTRKNLVIEHGERKQTLSEWARETGICKDTILYRLNRGWGIDRALSTTPKYNTRLIRFNGVTQTLRQWAEQLGMNESTLHMRLYQYKWSAEKAITTPVGGV